ncbi:T-cell surface glycoprotein CD1a-like isoform X2 [Diceros bicornis minor]|uniref:T-cell surface glycoprotein CD1a-like isoform X2 n=1 Tax=Diceros bicornis minor TaxID=77932 RepID=UPI0026EBB485|nr:T-cell surface glycoprotein CD1a-like isoform X2 [Diceros bicornis minor]
MLFLQLPLLVVLLPGGDNKDDFQEPVSFQLIQISSFYNRSSEENLGSGWLGELQTHGWESNSGTIFFLWPWSKGNFSNEEWMDLKESLHTMSIGFLQALHDYASQWQLEYKDALEILHKLFFETCPRFLMGLLDAGKAYLQRQVRPEAWLSTGPSPGPDHLMLVCHVSGFHPKPIRVMWMQGEQELLGTQRSDFLPNADGTWYLQVSLDVEAIEAAGLSCHVKHSSLGDQEIILFWERRRSMVLIFLAVIVPLVLLTGLAFWLRKCWTPCEPASPLRPLV